MGNKEYGMKMLEEGFGPRVIRSKLKESGYYIKKPESKKLSQEERVFYEHLFDTLRRDNF